MNGQDPMRLSFRGRSCEVGRAWRHRDHPGARGSRDSSLHSVGEGDRGKEKLKAVQSVEGVREAYIVCMEVRVQYVGGLAYLGRS